MNLIRLLPELTTILWQSFGTPLDMRYQQIKILSLYLFVTLLAVLNLGTINSEGFFTISLPLFEIMAIYHFCVHRENIFSLWFIFFIGIVSDSISGIPLGISSLTYMSFIKISQIIVQKRSPKEDFGGIFIEFISFLSAILLFKWLLLSVYYKNWLNITPILLQILITSLAYIVIYRLFEYLFENFLGLD